MKYILILVIILIFVSSCSDSSTNPISNRKIIPLEVGNQWIYKVDGYDSLGTNIISSRFDTTKVTDLDNGWYSISKLSKFSTNTKFQNRNNGLYVFNQGFGGEFIGLFFQFPTIKDNEYNINASSIIIRDTKKQVVTDLGLFDCIVYYYSPTQKGLNYDYTLFYLTPNVGIIKVEFYKFKYPDKNILQEIATILSKNF
jgi:hypothetical protein